MIYDSKTQVTNKLVHLLEQQLQWIINKQYASEPHYLALYTAIQNLSEQQSDDLHQVARQLTIKLQQLSIYIGEKMSSMIQNSFAEVQHMRQKMAESQQQLRNYKDKIQSLEQTRQSLKEKVSSWQQQYDNLKAQALQMQQKLQTELKRVQSEKKQLKRTFIQVQQETQQQRKMLESLQTEKSQISQVIEQSKQQKQALIQQIKLLRKKVELAQKKVQSSEGKYSYSGKKIAMLEQQIEQKNQLIQQYYQSQRPKLESMRQKQAYALSNILKNESISSEAALKKLSSEVQTFKLGQLVQINSEQYEMQYKRNKSHRGSIDQLQNEDIIKMNCTAIEQDSSQQQQQEIRKVPHVPDLYLAHYLLTVQSIKLKQNRQEYFHIDMAPFYKQLLMKAVPFHLWDQWIRQKLDKIADNMK